ASGGGRAFPPPSAQVHRLARTELCLAVHQELKSSLHWQVQGGSYSADSLGWHRDRVTSKKRGQALCQVARIFEVEQVAGVAKHERLNVRQPLKQQLLAPMKAGIAVLTNHGENGLDDLSGLVWSEFPLAQGWQFLAKERVRVSQRLLHGTRDPFLQDCSRIWTARPSKERLHGVHLVAGSVQFERAGNFGR